ncbi:MAG TPA: uroporphyrinogen-III synthase, partial [Thermoanaerobaculia bacterium]
AVAYRTIAAQYDIDELRALIASDAIDVVTFSSASTVDNFLGPLTTDERTRVLNRATIVSIGETTSAAIRRHGKEPDLVAANATMQAMHDAIVSSVIPVNPDQREGSSEPSR